MPIQVLDPKVAAKIAAGEVVERPASVVKELVENALDAGARQIQVEVLRGGVNLIRVSDDGGGIPAQEVALAFERYATSKIYSDRDLERITTLGFRGEALPSITAVSDTTLVTRTSEELSGSFISLRDGQVVESGPRGSRVGTTVMVRHLFARFPARLKFLKSPATEAGHITTLVQHYALAFPAVRFSLEIDGREAFRTSGSGKAQEVLAAMYGPEVAQGLLGVGPVQGDGPFTGGYLVEGWVSPPQVSRASRAEQSFFVNRRWVQSRLLGAALETAYEGMLMVSRHPLAVLCLTLPPEDVDVNIHPTKREVRFLREREVFSLVEKAVREKLTKEAPIPQVQVEGWSPQSTETTAAPAALDFGGWSTQLPERPVYGGPTATAGEGKLPILRMLGQLANTYIIAEGPEGMYLIDQHTAHERVLFERLQREWSQKRVEVQGLLEPLVVSLTPRQEELWREHQEALAELGFDLEPFGEHTFLLRSVPALIKDSTPAALTSLLDALDEEGSRGDWRQTMIISLACHSAVRAGQTLTEEEMRQLLQQLEGSTSPRTCPHGRPTMIHLSAAQLEREFGRR